MVLEFHMGKDIHPKPTQERVNVMNQTAPKVSCPHIETLYNSCASR